MPVHKKKKDNDIKTIPSVDVGEELSVLPRDVLVYLIKFFFTLNSALPTRLVNKGFYTIVNFCFELKPFPKQVHGIINSYQHFLKNENTLFLSKAFPETPLNQHLKVVSHDIPNNLLKMPESKRKKFVGYLDQSIQATKELQIVRLGTGVESTEAIERSTVNVSYKFRLFLLVFLSMLSIFIFPALAVVLLSMYGKNLPLFAKYGIALSSALPGAAVFLYTGYFLTRKTHLAQSHYINVVQENPMKSMDDQDNESDDQDNESTPLLNV